MSFLRVLFRMTLMCDYTSVCRALRCHNFGLWLFFSGPGIPIDEVDLFFSMTEFGMSVLHVLFGREQRTCSLRKDSSASHCATIQEVP